MPRRRIARRSSCAGAHGREFESGRYSGAARAAGRGGGGLRGGPGCVAGNAECAVEAGRDSHAARAYGGEPEIAGAGAADGAVHSSAEGAAGRLLVSKRQDGTRRASCSPKPTRSSRITRCRSCSSANSLARISNRKRLAGISTKRRRCRCRELAAEPPQAISRSWCRRSGFNSPSSCRTRTLARDAVAKWVKMEPENDAGATAQRATAI